MQEPERSLGNCSVALFTEIHLFERSELWISVNALSNTKPSWRTPDSETAAGPNCFLSLRPFPKKGGITHMCVGLSAKVVKISNGTAVVDAGGAKREVSSKLLENLEPGDYVMVHAGVAIAKITDEDESETDQLMEELL